MELLTTTVLLAGLKFPECPRWHDGRLWFSDMRAHTVMTVDPGGHAEPVVSVPGDPGGLGFPPDGGLLVVSMRERRLLRFASGALTTVADLNNQPPAPNLRLVTGPVG